MILSKRKKIVKEENDLEVRKEKIKELEKQEKKLRKLQNLGTTVRLKDVALRQYDQDVWYDLMGEGKINRDMAMEFANQVKGEGRFEKAEANLKNTLNEVNDRLSKIDKKDCRKKEILSMRI